MSFVSSLFTITRRYNTKRKMSTVYDKQLISKTTLTNLFHSSVVYHRKRLRQMFRAYFNPFNTTVVWTKDLPQHVINDLRLHLSWDLGQRMFYLNREQLGTRIIVRFQQLGILLFMKKIIIDDNKIVS